MFGRCEITSFSVHILQFKKLCNSSVGFGSSRYGADLRSSCIWTPTGQNQVACSLKNNPPHPPHARIWSTFRERCDYLFLVTFLATTSLLSCGSLVSGEKTHKLTWNVACGPASPPSCTPLYVSFTPHTHGVTCSPAMFATSSGHLIHPFTYARAAIALAKALANAKCVSPHASVVHSVASSSDPVSLPCWSAASRGSRTEEATLTSQSAIVHWTSIGVSSDSEASSSSERVNSSSFFC